MGHNSTLRDAESSAGNRDQSFAEARERVGRFAVELFANQHMAGPLVVEFATDDRRAFEFGPVDEDGLEEAAEDVLAAHHRELLLLDSPVEPATARRLARDRYEAITALMYLGLTRSRFVHNGDKLAKETLLRITDGAPLTICMGDAYRIGARRPKTVQTTEGVFGVSVKGCRTIFPDVVRTSGGKMWPGLCPTCGNAHRRPARDQRRALRRRLDSVFAGGTATTYEYRLTLPWEEVE